LACSREPSPSKRDATATFIRSTSRVDLGFPRRRLKEVDQGMPKRVSLLIASELLIASDRG
jgi:hypothetical protein